MQQTFTTSGTVVWGNTFSSSFWGHRQTETETARHDVCSIFKHKRHTRYVLFVWLGNHWHSLMCGWRMELLELMVEFRQHSDLELYIYSTPGPRVHALRQRCLVQVASKTLSLYKCNLPILKCSLSNSNIPLWLKFILYRPIALLLKTNTFIYMYNSDNICKIRNI